MESKDLIRFQHMFDSANLILYFLVLSSVLQRFIKPRRRQPPPNPSSLLKAQFPERSCLLDPMRGKPCHSWLEVTHKSICTQRDSKFSFVAHKNQRWKRFNDITMEKDRKLPYSEKILSLYRFHRWSCHSKKRPRLDRGFGQLLSSFVYSLYCLTLVLGVFFFP